MLILQHIFYVLISLMLNFGVLHTTEPRVMPNHNTGTIQTQGDPGGGIIYPDP